MRERNDRVYAGEAELVEAQPENMKSMQSYKKSRGQDSDGKSIWRQRGA
jgi:hypothetical protein